MRALRTLLTLAALAVALLLPALVGAQQRATLWLPDAAPDATITADTVEQLVAEILQADDDDHIVGRRGLRAALQAGAVPLPACLQGIEPCASPRHAAVQALAVERIVEVTAHGNGTRMHVQILDDELDPIDAFDVEATDVRAAVYQVVGRVTAANGFLRVRTTPPDATVFLDGESVGTAPFERNLPIGQYDVRVEADGYAPASLPIEIRVGDVRTLDVPLDRIFALVTIRSGTLDAAVYIDDDPTPRPINQPLRVDPGNRRIEVRGDIYATWSQASELEPGQDYEWRVNLGLSDAELARRQREEILSWPLRLQAGVSLSGYGTDASGASGDTFGAERDVVCPLDADGRCDTARGALLGIEGDVIYSARLLEFGVLGLGLRRSGLGDDAAWTLTDTDELISLRRKREFALRLPSVGARYLVDHRFEVFARTGPALAFERFVADELGPAASPDTVAFSRRSLLWDVRGGARIHASSFFYATAELHLAANISHAEPARVGGILGIGVNLAAPFGLGRAPEAP